MLLGSTGVKAAFKMLMKLTPDDALNNKTKSKRD